jgi:hypothetical protein
VDVLMEADIVRVEEKVNHLEKLCHRQERDIQDICAALKDLRSDTDGFIRDIHRDIASIKVSMAKPQGVSWAVMIIINMLAVISTGLIVYLVTTGQVL